MIDKEWMLNPQAIRHAKQCMQIIKEELGVKLMLSNPHFMALLHEYVEMIESRELGLAYAQLIAMGGPGSVLAEIPPKHAVQTPAYVAAVGSDAPPQPDQDPDETVTVNGRDYPRWNEGKEFRNLYRGQPYYR